MRSDGRALTKPLDLCAELIEWSELSGLEGDHLRLWRMHGALSERMHAPALPRAAIPNCLRRL